MVTSHIPNSGFGEWGEDIPQEPESNSQNKKKTRWDALQQTAHTSVACYAPGFFVGRVLLPQARYMMNSFFCCCLNRWRVLLEHARCQMEKKMKKQRVLLRHAWRVLDFFFGGTADVYLYGTRGARSIFLCWDKIHVLLLWNAGYMFFFWLQQSQCACVTW